MNQVTLLEGMCYTGQNKSKERGSKMLDAKDLKAIAELINARAGETEKHLESLLDTRIQQTEELLDTRIQQTEELIDSRIQQTEESFNESLDTRTKQLEELIDTRITQSEEFLMDEMERYDKKYEKQFDDVKQRLGALEGVYRMTKNETETINLSLRLIENLDKRVTKLEARAVV